MNDCEEEEEGGVGWGLYPTRAKYSLCTRRAQRTVIDVIVRGNWLPSSHKTAACCLVCVQVSLRRATSKT